MKNIKDHSTSLFLILFFCADLAFIMLHSISTKTRFINNPFFSLENDMGYPEIYQYLKWFWIIILFAYIAISKRSFSYVTWGLVFTYFLCDDSLSIHETGGDYIAKYLEARYPTLTSPFGLRFEDLGELAVSAAAGIILFPPVVWAYLYGSQSFKKMSRDMLLLIFALVFFGVVVDMAHMSIHFGAIVTFILGVIEDGGEMLVASLILWYVFLLSVRNENETVTTLKHKNPPPEGV